MANLLRSFFWMRTVLDLLQEWYMEVYIKVCVWWMRVLLRARAKGVCPLTILLCSTVKTLSLCADYAGLLTLVACTANGITQHNNYYWATVICVAKPFLTTTLTTLAKKCGAQTEKVSYCRFKRCSACMACCSRLTMYWLNAASLIVLMFATHCLYSLWG